LGAPTHLPLSCPSCSHTTYLKKTSCQVTSQDEIFMLSTEGYILESIAPSVSRQGRLNTQSWVLHATPTV